MRAIRGGEIGMIFQEPMTSLNPVQTIGAQIVEAIRTHSDMDKGAALDRAVDLLDRVGINQPAERARQYPHAFSGGMRQRAMIAMALSSDPALLIADEPTTAVDVTVEAQILDLIADLKAERGMSVMLITHDLNVVGEVADRVIVMYLGQVVETTTADRVFDAPAHPYTQGLLDSLPSIGRRDPPETDRRHRARPARAAHRLPLRAALRPCDADLRHSATDGAGGAGHDGGLLALRRGGCAPCGMTSCFRCAT